MRDESIRSQTAKAATPTIGPRPTLVVSPLFLHCLRAVLGGILGCLGIRDRRIMIGVSIGIADILLRDWQAIAQFLRHFQRTISLGDGQVVTRVGVGVHRASLGIGDLVGAGVGRIGNFLVGVGGRVGGIARSIGDIGIGIGTGLGDVLLSLFGIFLVLAGGKRQGTGQGEHCSSEILHGNSVVDKDEDVDEYDAQQERIKIHAMSSMAGAASDFAKSPGRFAANRPTFAAQRANCSIAKTCAVIAGRSAIARCFRASPQSARARHPVVQSAGKRTRIAYRTTSAGAVSGLSRLWHVPCRRLSRAECLGPPSSLQEHTMLHYAVVFFVIAIIAAVLGFGGIAGAATGIAKILFIVFVILAIASLLFGRKKI